MFNRVINIAQAAKIIIDEVKDELADAFKAEHQDGRTVYKSGLHTDPGSTKGDQVGGLIRVNGVEYRGNTITVTNDGIKIDGKTVNFVERDIKVEVIGDIETLEVGAGHTQVSGSVRSLRTGSGDVYVAGDAGSVSTGSGDVDIDGSVSGDVHTGSGDITIAKA